MNESDKTLVQHWNDFIEAVKWDDFVWWVLSVAKSVLIRVTKGGKKLCLKR